MTSLHNIDTESFIRRQLESWELAGLNFMALEKIESREIMLGDFPVILQHNPSRKHSTLSKTDAASIASRQCFLCKEKRPEMQNSINISDKWEFLINPYPIFNPHFTIASLHHIPQSEVPSDAFELASVLPGMVVFFNGAGAGASAPDHLHLQAVGIENLPLIKLVERLHDPSDEQIVSSDSFNKDFPFLFFSGCFPLLNEKDEIRENSEIIEFLKTGGLDSSGRFTDLKMVNWFFWKDGQGNYRCVVIPRRAHRPSCYYASSGNLLISPGCIDMAGVVICVRKEDFLNINKDSLQKIYQDVAIQKID